MFLKHLVKRLFKVGSTNVDKKSFDIVNHTEVGDAWSSHSDEFILMFHPVYGGTRLH